MYLQETKSDMVMQGFSLIIAPCLFAASTFFWHNGEYNVPAATLLIVSLFFWIPALSGLFAYVKTRMPLYATLGLWVAVFGCISGVCFAFLGYLTTIFNIEHAAYLSALEKYPFSSQLLLFSTGPLFPLSILLLGIIMLFTKAIKPWVAILLCVAAVAFPVSRISRNISIAHIADLLLMIPAIYVGLLRLQTANKMPD
ncbi:MAG TPA: hypothetical protein PKM63_18530 [Panacibacter sp.]|nr:hypothetical protein [Panacibacter sp.]HNP46298.1 hypothetical protein [Panacibacter sp.]